MSPMGYLLTLGAGVCSGAKYPLIADEHQAVAAIGLLSVERILQALWSGHEATQRGGNPSLSQ
jgi:hypothetical protein